MFRIWLNINPYKGLSMKTKSKKSFFLMGLNLSCFFSFLFVKTEDILNQKRLFQEVKFEDATNRSYVKNLLNLFEKNNPKTLPISEYPKIPLIIHQIWVGGKPLPSFYANLAKTWKNFHPEWQYILWDDEAVSKIDMINAEYYKKEKSLSAKANLLRLEVLYKYGGMYVDIDMECLAKFDLFHYQYDFYTGITPINCTAILQNALIACKPRDEIILACINEVPRQSDRLGQTERNGVRLFSFIFLSNLYSYQGIHAAFPASFFYPIEKCYLNNIADPIKGEIAPESMAIHYWGSTISQKELLYEKICFEKKLISK